MKGDLTRNGLNSLYAERLRICSSLGKGLQGFSQSDCPLATSTSPFTPVSFDYFGGGDGCKNEGTVHA